MSIASVADLIKRFEGLRLAAYDDATAEPVPVGGTCVGTLTIGYGETGANVYPGQICTEAEANAWLDAKIAAISEQLPDVIGPGWDAMGQERQGALISMAYNMGVHGLSEFRDMIVGIQSDDWPEAKHQALNSKWARQVPSRAAVTAEILLTGRWPA